MFRLIVRVALLIVTFAVLLFGVRVIGAQAKSPLADTFTEITQPDGQKQACWHGICPGLTSTQEAEARLDADATLMRHSVNGKPCWGDAKYLQVVCPESTDGQVKQLFFMYSYPAPQGPQLGDMVAWWGTPVKSSIGPVCDVSYILFDNHVLAFTDDLPSQVQSDHTYVKQLEAQSQLRLVTIAAPGVQIDVSDLFGGTPLTVWRGFASYQSPYIGCGR